MAIGVNKTMIRSLLVVLLLSGCSTIEWVQARWPRDHDPSMVQNWVSVQMALNRVDCESAGDHGWAGVVNPSERLALYTEFRSDPQATNMRGLADHAVKMSKGSSPAFCRLGLKTAQARLDQARTAWEGR